MGRRHRPRRTAVGGLRVPLIFVRPEARALGLPARATTGAAGMDLRACLGAKGIELSPGARAAIPTGLAVALPPGFEGQVRPRSGLALRHGITVLNAPGTIDCDYRGEIKVIVANLGEAPFVVEHGKRIAQLIVARTTPVCWATGAALSETARGTGGFGSTGS